MEFRAKVRWGGVLKTRQRKRALWPPKTEKWGSIIDEWPFKEKLRSQDHMVKFFQALQNQVLNQQKVILSDNSILQQRKWS